MKYFFLLLACLGMSKGLIAQTLLDDAKNLREIFNEGTKDSQNRPFLKRGISLSATQVDILKNYFSDTIDISSLSNDQFSDGLEPAFKDNPFLRVEITDQDLLGITKLDKVQNGQGGTSASGFSVAGFADGLSRFLVKRTKQELSQAFFEDFKKTVKKDTLLGHFCPFTKQQILLVDQDVYQFKDYLEGLRESFIADMTAMPGSMESFLRDTALCVKCDNKPEGKVMIDLLHLAQQMVNGEAPIDMIDYLARPGSAIQSADMATEPVLYDMAGGLRFLHLVSESLRNTESADSLMPWYTGREIREMFKDPKLFRIYLGLLWQKSGVVSFAGANRTETIQLRDILKKAAETDAILESWRNSIASFGEVTHSVQRAIRAGSNSPQTAADDFFRYAQSLNDLMQTVNQTGRILLNRQTDLIPQEYIFLMRQCNSLYFNIRQRNYTGAISNVIYCLNLLGKDKKQIATMLKYANFVASIAEANSSEEVENAIELFALPPGSSRMKKQPKRFSVALNAFTGLAIGSERLTGDGSVETKTFSAVAAPVGISCSWGLGKAGSLGFFVPLIDVGAVTAYRFDDKNTGSLPELTWGNILTPGLYGVWDLPGRIPLALGGGWQVGPNLRKVTQGLNEIEKSGTRWGVFLAVDIPVTFFYLGKGN
ncbi:MAG: hypothetical protein ACKVT2_14840 [Saprospiraceae bacterium]